MTESAGVGAVAGAGAHIGLIGLGVMGQNLVLNMARNGYRVAVFNRTTSVVQDFMAGPARGVDNIIGATSIEQLVSALATPRRIMLMVKAGSAVDAVIAQLEPYLNAGDIIIDGGNSLFKDTARRAAALEAKGLRYLGVGVSGGEEGALKGPSIMPGGSRDAWEAVSSLLTDIAAKAPSGEPCCAYLGPGGAGHFVKMVHNGVEYVDMQLIAETYFFMRETLGMDVRQMQQLFAQWNQGELESYLIEITAEILGKTDAATGKPMVDMIMDRAGQKGTGKWTAQEALDLGAAAPTMAEAVFARAMSAARDERCAAAAQLPGPKPESVGGHGVSADDLKQALYAAKICAYAQGFELMKLASREYGWELDLGGIALLWRGGCIIRAQFLERIKEAYTRNPQLDNLILDPYFRQVVVGGQEAWRRVVAAAAQTGIPVPALSSSLAYYDSYRRCQLPANLIQAQRDYFGAHTYERVDAPGWFHTDWLVDGDVVSSEPV
ncbi:MAG: 6-phosphogluconate dehydrogenase, NADP(+)-dependent, decarboxylating [Firmicutes bacterium ADurb.Bin506]|nr:MAG: 6-phosphogluconate dehydrogenase, NADP(+)-dependent, decarboxylating [Firmicutes bacterium ADurb.Bin506]